MRVLFDGFWWREGPLSNRMVEREFVTTWLRDHPDDEAAVLVPAADAAAARAELPSGVRVMTTRLRPHGVAAALSLPGAARRFGADVVVAHNFTPVRGRSVTFVHDVLFQTNPEWFTTAERVYLAPIPRLARRAGAVVTSTRTEAERIRQRNPRLGRVEAVGLAVGSSLAAATPRRPAGLPDVDGFALTVSRLNVRKNLARTVEAAERSTALGARRPLVVVGEPDGRPAQLASTDDATASRTVFLPRVDDAELAWLYAHTELFCYLSLDEGFGLPPVEARHFGAAVLASDVAVLRETLGSEADFVDPLDSHAIAAAMDRLLSSPGTRHAADLGLSWSASVGRLRAIAADVAATERLVGRRS